MLISGKRSYTASDAGHGRGVRGTDIEAYCRANLTDGRLERGQYRRPWLDGPGNQPSDNTSLRYH